MRNGGAYLHVWFVRACPKILFLIWRNTAVMPLDQKCCANMKHPNKAHTEVREKGICCQLSCTFSFLLFRTLGLKRERTGKTEWYGVHESERNEIQPTLFYASRILLLHPSQSDIAKPFMEPDPSNNPSSFVRRGFPFKYISVRSHFWIFKSGSSPQR